MGGKKVVAVIGSGAGGSSVVSELLEADYLVMHFDENSKPLGKKSTSAGSCNGILSGIHYGGDTPTALEVFNSSFLTMKKYPGCTLETQANETAGAVYLVTSESTFSLDRTRETAEAILNRYKALAKNEADQVFGPPNQYIQEIKIPGQNYNNRDSTIELIENEKILQTVPGEIPHTHLDEGKKVTMKVVGAFLVQEPLIDPNKLREHFTTAFQPYVENSQLVKYYSEKVENITFDDARPFDFKIQTTKTNQPEKKTTYEAQAVVNAAWVKINEIGKSVSEKLNSSTEELVVRPKFTIVVEIPVDAPRELHDMPTKKFTSGSFCTITRNNKIGSKQGQFILTFENVGNLKEYKLADSVPTEITGLQDELYGANSANTSRSAELAAEIHRGSANYIPEAYKEFFLAAQIVEKRLVFVMQPLKNTKSLKVNLRDPNDGSHERSLQSGIREMGTGYIEHACLKLCACVPAAKVVVERLGVHFEVRERKEKELNGDRMKLLPQEERLRTTARVMHEADLTVKLLSSERQGKEFINRNAYCELTSGQASTSHVATNNSSDDVSSVIKTLTTETSNSESRRGSNSPLPSPNLSDSVTPKHNTSSSSTGSLNLARNFVSATSDTNLTASGVITSTAATTSQLSQSSNPNNLAVSAASSFTWSASGLKKALTSSITNMVSSLKYSN